MSQQDDEHAAGGPASGDPAWIETLPPEAWAGDLEPLKARCADPESGRVDHVLLVHSLHPAGLDGHLSVYRAAMSGTPGLRKVDREMVALAVSQLNGCHY